MNWLLLWTLLVLLAGPGWVQSEVTSGGQTPGLSVRGLRLIIEGNGIEVKSDALGKLDEGPAAGQLTYTLYVAKSAAAPFEKVNGAVDFKIGARTPLAAEGSDGHRRTGKDTLLFIDREPLSWRDGDPWPAPRRYRVGEKRAGAAETLSAPTEPRPVITFGAEPDQTRIELLSLPDNDWMSIPVSFACEDQHYDIPGAHFTVQAGQWTGHQWSSRAEGTRAFQPPGTGFSPTFNALALRFPASLKDITLNIAAEGEGYSAKRTFTIVPPAPAVAERNASLATSRQRRDASLESRRRLVDERGANIAATRERIAANLTDSAMRDEVKRLQDGLAGAQLEYAAEKLTLSENDPRGEADLARQDMNRGAVIAAVERERALEIQLNGMLLQRWAGDAERARAAREQNDSALLDVERRRAAAAELAGIAAMFRSACEEQLKILESKRDPAAQGKVLEAMAHGSALLTGDREAAADTLRRARTALLAGAPDTERGALQKRFDEEPLPEWWPATAQAGPVIKSQKDPYWEWYPGFVKQVRQKYAVVSGNMRNAGHLSLAIAKLRARQYRLKTALEAGTGNGQFSDNIRERMQAAIQHARQSEQFFHNEASRQEKEALEAYESLAEELDRVSRLWGADHPDLAVWRDNTRELARRLPLQLAEAAGSEERIASLLRDANSWQSVPPYTAMWLRLVETRLNILRGELLPALFTLRDLHRENPVDADIRRKLTEVEAALVKQGLSKAGGAIAEARANFNRYLTERGFGVGEKDTSWLAQQSSGLRDYDSETAWVIWSTGIIGGVTQALGRADEEEAKLAQKEKPLHNAYLGLQVMARLCVRGLTLAEIRRLDAAAILQELPPRTTAGKPWDLQDAAVFRIQIDAALALEDVRKLVDDERDGLEAELRKAYWDPAEASSTWLEWVGDLSSPRNILTLWAPMLRVQAGSEVVTVTQLINRKLGIEATLKWAGTKEWGGRVAQVLLDSAAYRKDSYAWAAGKFIALSGLQAATSCLGKKFAGNYGQIAVDGFFTLAGDPDALAGWLTEAKASRNAVEAMLEATEKAAASRAKALAEVDAVRNEVISALQRLEQNPSMTLDPSLDERLKAFLGTDWLKAPMDNLPTGGADDVVRALVEAIQAARQRARTGAAPALTELGETIQAEAALCAETITAVNTVRTALGRGAPTASETLECFLPIAVEQWRKLAFGNKNPWVVPPDSRTAQAFGFLHGGKPAEAAEAFLALAREAESGMKGASPLPPQVLHWLSDMAGGVAKLPPRSASGGLDPAITEHITPDLADTLVAKAQSAVWTKRDVSSITFLEEAGKKFAVKKVSQHTQELPLLVRAAEGEMLHMGLCYALGINAPAVAVRPRVAADGNLEMYIITRFVQGEELAELTAARMFQFSEDLSAHRGLALLLGDYDRKAGNYMITAGGALCAMDGASADIRGRMAKVMFSSTVDHPEMMEGVWNLGHWLRRCRFSFDKHGIELAPDVKATLLAELSLTSGPARNAVTRLRKLTPEHLVPFLRLAREPFANATPELKAAYAALNGPEGFDAAKAAAEIMADMGGRMGRADEALSTLHKRHGLPEFKGHDLVYGPVAGGELVGMTRRFGGETLQDYGTSQGFASGSGGEAWTKYSLEILDQWAAKNDGRMVRFDLTHMEGLAEILAGTGPRSNAVTSQELRHIQKNWDRFKNCVKFYRGGIEVPPPWTP